MGKSKRSAEVGKSLQVDARAPGRRAAFDEFDSIPQTTCFGFRRKTSSGRSEQLKDDLVSRPRSQVEDSKQGQVRLCGASSILRTFSSIGPDNFEAPVLREKSGDSLAVAECSAQSNGKILASYENIAGIKHEVCRDEDTERDGDREDGADSIGEEDEDTFDTPKWLVDPHDIYFVSKADGTGKICRLGKGDFGPVYMGVWKDQEAAVKLARQKPITLKQERNFQTQVARLHHVRHPNLVQLLGACCWKGGKRSVLVTEHMDKGDLRTLLGREDLTAKFAWVQHGKTIALDIAQGLAHLHSKGIIHGRLKSTNVLLNKAGIAKLSDANLSQLLSHCKDLSIDKNAPPGTKASSGVTCAPEVAAGAELTTAADMYSFGVILWELLSMEKPERSLRSIRTPEEAPARIAYLVERLLAKDPSQRPSAEKVVSIISHRQ